MILGRPRITKLIFAPDSEYLVLFLNRERPSFTFGFLKYLADPWWQNFELCLRKANIKKMSEHPSIIGLNVTTRTLKPIIGILRRPRFTIL